jgi:acetyl esterase
LLKSPMLLPRSQLRTARPVHKRASYLVQIDPTFKAYLSKAISERPIPLDQVDVLERRKAVALNRANLIAATPPSITVREATFAHRGNSVSGLVFRNTQWSGQRPVILYFHGGGWMYGSPEQSAELAYLYALETGATVISPRYRLTPEHPFPAAFDDCYLALLWAEAHQTELGGPGAKIIVAGESAGGNLAAAVSLKARDSGGPTISLQLLNYPALGLDFESDSYVRNANAPILSRSEMRFFWKNYLGDGLVNQQPLSVPLLAKSLAGLPPAHVIVAEHDPLLDDGIRYVKRLIDSGVSAELYAAAGLTHGFFRALSESTYVARIAQRLVRAIKNTLI